MSEEATPPTFGYVGRCRVCQSALAWRRDDPARRADVASKVGTMILAGLYVEYTRADSVDMAREMCGCVRQERFV
jgi:hypothetical protein